MILIIVHYKRNIFSPGNSLVIVGVAVFVDKHLADDLVYLAVEEVADGLEHPARQLAERVARKRLSIGNVRAEKLHMMHSFESPFTNSSWDGRNGVEVEVDFFYQSLKSSFFLFPFFFVFGLLSLFLVCHQDQRELSTENELLLSQSSDPFSRSTKGPPLRKIPMHDCTQKGAAGLENEGGKKSDSSSVDIS